MLSIINLLFMDPSSFIYDGEKSIKETSILVKCPNVQTFPEMKTFMKPYN